MLPLPASTRRLRVHYRVYRVKDEWYREFHTKYLVGSLFHYLQGFIHPRWLFGWWLFDFFEKFSPRTLGMIPIVFPFWHIFFNWVATTNYCGSFGTSKFLVEKPRIIFNPWNGILPSLKLKVFFSLKINRLEDEIHFLKWLPSLKPRHFRPWKWMVEIRSFPFWDGLYLREVILHCWLPAKVPRCQNFTLETLGSGDGDVTRPLKGGFQ